MRKGIVLGAMMLAVMFALGGCGNADIVNETETSANIDGFEKAQYDKFNSYASENGLGGTLIYIEGKVLNQTKLDNDDSEFPVLGLVVEQDDGNRWCVSVLSNNEIEMIEEKSVRVFGTYMGFSDVFNLPGLSVIIDDEEHFENAKIEVLNKSGDYETVWTFENYVNQVSAAEQNTEMSVDEKSKNPIENSGSNVEKVDEFTFVYDENNKVNCSIIKDLDKGTETVSVMIECEKNKYDFGSLCYAMAGVNMSELKDYLVSLTIQNDKGYALACTNGKQVTLENPELNENPDKEQSDKSIEFMQELNEFLGKNKLIKEKVMVFEDDKVKIYYSGLNNKGIVFDVENMTDANITIQADTISINGESINSIIMSDDVAPQSKGKVTAKCNIDENTDVKSIGGQLRIIDFEKSFKSYKAKFINVPIE